MSTYSPKGVEVHRFRYFVPRSLHRVAFRGGIWFNVLRDPLAILQLPFFFMSFLWQSVAHSGRSSLIHANWLVPSGIVGLVLRKLRGKKLVVSTRGSDANLASRNRLAFLLASPAARKADAVICVSREIKRNILSWGIPPDKVDSFPDGVDDLASAGSRNILAISFVGRLVPEKRVQDLIEAVGMLPVEGLQVSIAGDGPLMKQLYERAMGTRGGAFKFLGTVPRNRVPEMIRSHAALVLPSSSEGLPDVVLMAMATATPVVATRLLGMLEVVEDGVTGRLVPVGSPKSLAQAIQDLCQKPPYGRRLGLRAKKSVMVRFGRERMVSRLVVLYARVISSESRKIGGRISSFISENGKRRATVGPLGEEPPMKPRLGRANLTPGLLSSSDNHERLLEVSTNPNQQ